MTGVALPSWLLVALHAILQVAFVLRALLWPHREPASRMAWVTVIAVTPPNKPATSTKSVVATSLHLTPPAVVSTQVRWPPAAIATSPVVNPPGTSTAALPN